MPSDPVDHICLIDDDRIYVQTMRMILEKLKPGIRLAVYQDSEDALSRLQSMSLAELPQVIMIDMNMPKLDGWNFLDAILPYSQRWDKVPRLYMVSSSVDELEIERATSHPLVTGYLVKPIARSVLEKILLGQ